MLRSRDQYDLPRRSRGHVPPCIVELGVALVMVAAAIGLRLLIDRYFQDVTPFALVFPAVVFATLLAGARSGLIVILLGQTLAWYHLLPVVGSFGFASAGHAVSLIVNTMAQLILVWAVAGYRQAADRTAALERDRIEGLELALRELAHRTKNNFQLAAALLNLQARRHKGGPVAHELQAAAGRLMAVANIHGDGGARGGDVTRVALDDYLGETCRRLRQGLIRDGIVLLYEAERVEVGHDCALQVGLIVNELVTNALKHAFRDRDGRIDVTLRASRSEILLTVSDDGPGAPLVMKSDGIGSELVAMLARRLNARLTRLDQPGTAFMLFVPHKRGDC